MGKTINLTEDPNSEMSQILARVNEYFAKEMKRNKIK